MMLRRLLLVSSVLMSVIGTANTACAQGLVVSTHVYDLSGGARADRKTDVARNESVRSESIISSSLSLFHNGRVYDYVDAADEVVIFDPYEKRFTILNTARELSTTLSFEEIRHMLETRIPAVEQYIKELGQQKNPSAERIAETLRFQLHPDFRHDFDMATGMLTLSAPSWTYRVTTREWADKEQVEKYLTYADWAARLNHILHPRSLFPEPRIELNAALRNLNNRLPISVHLDLTPKEPLNLRAEHRFTLDLDENDRGRIARWDNALNNPGLRKLSFRNYQQTVLVSDRR